MGPATPYEFVFQLYPTSAIFRKGHRIRLDVNSNDGELREDALRECA